jgi:hypothetical protein
MFSLVVNFATEHGYTQRTIKARIVQHAMSLGQGATFGCDDLLAEMRRCGEDVPMHGTQQVRAALQSYINTGLIEVVSRGVFRVADGAFTGQPVPSREMRDKALDAARRVTPERTLVSLTDDLLRALFRCFLRAGPTTREYEAAAGLLGQLDEATLMGWQAAWDAEEAERAAKRAPTLPAEGAPEYAPEEA